MFLNDFRQQGSDKIAKVSKLLEKEFGIKKLNPNAQLIKGVICGNRIEEIDNPLTQQVRFLDKLVDELAKGRKMEKILRKNWEVITKEKNP